MNGCETNKLLFFLTEQYVVIISHKSCNLQLMGPHLNYLSSMRPLVNSPYMIYSFINITETIKNLKIK